MITYHPTALRRLVHEDPAMLASLVEVMQDRIRELSELLEQVECESADELRGVFRPAELPFGWLRMKSEVLQ